MEHPFDCPYCYSKLIVEVYRWNTKTICPLCLNHIEVDFDFSYNAEDNEEYDYYELKPISREKYFDDFLEFSITKEASG